MQVVIRDEPSMNLLGLLLRTRLENATGPIEGEVEVVAGAMHVALRFRGDAVEVMRGDSRTGEPPKHRARIEGTLSALLDCARGRGVVRNFVTRAIRVGGDPRLLFRFARALGTL
ncbi:MAG: hypothetical protein HYY84_03970 [Deltaproteobacteria bacterium]|nr:hypothetical protein [Deltaproteobacteria bacterium]